MCRPKELPDALVERRIEIELEQMEAGTWNPEEPVADPIAQAMADNSPFVEGDDISDEALQNCERGWLLNNFGVLRDEVAQVPVGNPLNIGSPRFIAKFDDLTSLIMQEDLEDPAVFDRISQALDNHMMLEFMRRWLPSRMDYNSFVAEDLIDQVAQTVGVPQSRIYEPSAQQVADRVQGFSLHGVFENAIPGMLMYFPEPGDTMMQERWNETLAEWLRQIQRVLAWLAQLTLEWLCRRVHNCYRRRLVQYDHLSVVQLYRSVIFSRLGREWFDSPFHEDLRLDLSSFDDQIFYQLGFR